MAERPVVAAVDCGTNTIKLLIGAFPDVAVRESRMVRLGEDLDRTGRLADAALARAFAAVEEYADLVRAHGAARVRFVATSATRDAANADVFTAGVRERLGVAPEVVSGEEEAALALAGALGGLRTPVDGPVLVVDVGGGSTELVLGRLGAEGPDVLRPVVLGAVSVDVGSVRMHERHLRSDPPTADELAACSADVDAALEAGLAASGLGALLEAQPPAAVVGVAGTVTSVAAGVLDLAAYDREAIDQQVLPVEAVREEVRRLTTTTVAERRALPWMHPGRADVIDGGAVVLERVLRRVGARELVVSEADILDGIAWSIAGSVAGSMPGAVG